tara:strand:+ start:20 stop:586 length:567 start_codon:yes stop_codon:yes gene_type:complete
MSVTINGNGTITGYTPVADGSITAAKLASGAITTAALPAGSIIKVTTGTFTGSALMTTSSSFQQYTPSNITVTKVRGPQNVSGGSKLIILGNAWIQYDGTSANSRHLVYSIMRDGTEVSGLTYGLGNLFSTNANGYQGNADIKYPDPTNQNAGDYVYSMTVKSHDGTVTCRIGETQRLGTWTILEVAV